MVYCLSEKPESIFIPVLFPPIAEKKRGAKRNFLILENSQMKLTLPLSPNLCHSCKQEKTTQIKAKHSINFLSCLFAGDEP